MRAELLGLLEDPVLDVRAMAAEALGHLGEAEKATPVLIDIIRRGNTHESLAAITALEAFGRSGVLPMEKVRALIPKEMQGDSNRVVEAIDKIK
jgi:HEAT repeat protein